MSGKSDYKKINSCWNQSEIKGTTRAAIKQEDTDFGSEKSTRYKKKVHKKPAKRADHKHKYEVVLVRYADDEKRLFHYDISKVCSVCGRKEGNFWRQQLSVKGPYSFYVEESLNGLLLYRHMTDEEILSRYSNLKIIERTDNEDLA